MDETCELAAMVGRLRQDSINRKVANALVELAPAALKFSIIEIGHLPIYNQEDDENPPAAWLSAVILTVVFSPGPTWKSAGVRLQIRRSVVEEKCRKSHFSAQQSAQE
jgi:hypothetical protein